MLDKDVEFRYAIAGYLVFSEILKRFEEHDRKFNEILPRIGTIEKRLEERGRGFDEIMARLEEHDRKFDELLMRFDQLSERVEVTIGSMGRRWGRDLEKLVYELFKKGLEGRGVDVSKVLTFSI